MENRFTTTPSFTVRKASSGNATARAFVVEALVLVAFLAVSVAIVLQVFVAAGTMSREAHVLSMSEHLATNAAERFAASPLDTEAVSYFTSKGEPLPSKNTASFAVETMVTQEQRETGTLCYADIRVTHFPSRYDAQVSYELDTARYLSEDQIAAGESTGSEG